MPKIFLFFINLLFRNFNIQKPQQLPTFKNIQVDLYTYSTDRRNLLLEKKELLNQRAIQRMLTIRMAVLY